MTEPLYLTDTQLHSAKRHMLAMHFDELRDYIKFRLPDNTAVLVLLHYAKVAALEAFEGQ